MLASVRFFSFMAIGASGVAVHLGALRLGLVVFGLEFVLAQLGATVVAMTSNFSLNNAITYADQRLRGLAVLKGLVTYYGICALGALGGTVAASWLYGETQVWWLAGMLGAAVGALWNYLLSAALVWKPG